MSRHSADPGLQKWWRSIWPPTFTQEHFCSGDTCWKFCLILAVWGGATWDFQGNCTIWEWVYSCNSQLRIGNHSHSVLLDFIWNLQESSNLSKTERHEIVKFGNHSPITCFQISRSCVRQEKTLAVVWRCPQVSRSIEASLSRQSFGN